MIAKILFDDGDDFSVSLTFRILGAGARAGGVFPKKLGISFCFIVSLLWILAGFLFGWNHEN